MAGKNDDNELHQDIICKGTGSLGGHITIFHVSFNSHLGGHLGGHVIFYVFYWLS